MLADGRQQDVHFDKITFRIEKLCYGLNMDFVDPVHSVSDLTQIYVYQLF